MAFVDSECRYEELGKLGEGGMGVVYEVRDVIRNMRVALKTLRHVNAENIYRLKREFRALSELSHPNIINLYELVADRDGWFMTMEVVEGQDILAYVRGERDVSDLSPARPSRQHRSGSSSTTSITAVSAVLHLGKGAPSISESIGLPTPPLHPTPIVQVVDIEFLITSLTQLAEALIALHDAGKVHRDLKPSNVLVTREGRVVLMDFGIVAELSHLSEVDAGALGTPHYMAPEQAAARAPHISADWYAFGVIMYQALTGRLPFKGASMQVIQIKQIRTPLRPKLFTQGIPEHLEQLCYSLLSIDSDARPTGEQVLAQLGAPRRRRRRHTTTPSVAMPLFVGRKDELAALDQQFEAAHRGERRCVVVSGPSGMGKTCLMQHFLANRVQALSNVLILQGQCHERESVSYTAFEGVIGRLCHYLEHLPGRRRALLLPADLNSAAPMFPALERLTTDTVESPAYVGDGVARKRARGMAALCNLIANVAAATTVVLVIEDIQWADSDSLDLLFELVACSAHTAILLSLTVRLEQVHLSAMAPVSHAHQIIARLETLVPCQRIHLPPLTLNEQRRLVKDALEFAEFQHAADHLDGLLWHQPIGHPMLILELMRSANEFNAGNTPTLDEMLQARATGLGTDARILIELIAIAGQALPLHVFAKACSQSPEQCERALSVLRVNLLVHNQRNTSQPWPAIYHDAIRDAIVARMSDDARVSLHRELARALAQWPDAPHSVIAEHWLGAKQPEMAAFSRFHAAREAVAALAVDRARELYLSVLELMPGEPVRWEHALLLCRTYIGLVETARLLDSHVDTQALLERARAIAEPRKFIEELATIHYLWGSFLFRHSDPSSCLREQQRACEYAEQARSPYLEARALSGMGDAYYISGRMIAAHEHFAACVDLARRYAFDDIAAANLTMRGMTLFYQNDFRSALQDSLNAATTAVRIGHRRAEIIARGGGVAWILYEMGDFDQARMELDRALTLARQFGVRLFEPNALSFTARILSIQGQRSRAIELARESVSICRQQGMAFVGPMALSALAFVTDDLDERDRALDEGWQRLRKQMLSHNHLWFHRDAIDTSMNTGDARTMDAHARALEEYTQGEPLPWCRFHIARARALSAHLRGQGSKRALQALLDQAYTVGLRNAARALEQALMHDEGES